MPYIGLGIHVIIALFFAIHALKTGRNLFWLIVLFSFPLLGSIVYFVVEFYPDMRSSRSARSAASSVAKFVDPTRDLREARKEFDLANTVATRMQLARALMAARQYEEAITHLSDSLTAQHVSDPDILNMLAQANMETGVAAGTAAALSKLIDARPERNTGDTALLLARALGASNSPDADAAFQHALATSSGAEAKLRYGQWLAGQQKLPEATLQFEQICSDAKHWPPHTMSLNKEWLRSAKSALAELNSVR